MVESFRNVCAKFQADRLCCVRTGAGQVLNTQKSFLGNIHLTMKTATSNTLLNTFSNQITICQISFEVSISFRVECKYFNSLGYFPFLVQYAIEMK